MFKNSSVPDLVSARDTRLSKSFTMLEVITWDNWYINGMVYISTDTISIITYADDTGFIKKNTVFMA